MFTWTQTRPKRENVRKIRLDPFERGLIDEPIVEPSPYRGLIWALLLAVGLVCWGAAAIYTWPMWGW